MVRTVDLSSTNLRGCTLCDVPKDGHGSRYVQLHGWHEYRYPDNYVRALRKSQAQALRELALAIERADANYLAERAEFVQWP